MIKDSKNQPIWPNAIQSNTAGVANELLSWIFQTWNSHADVDDAGLKDQYIRRAEVLKNVEIAIQHNRRSGLQNMLYRIRLHRDLHRSRR